MQTVALVALVSAGQQDPAPEADDVTAGPWGLLVFLLLIAATVVLMFSFVKQLRKTERARKAGVFGPVEPEDDDQPPVTPGADAPGSRTPSD
ncbi:hypothetical protein [Nocardioides bigeumensis]|uniref:Uncharacterized protein n=1 Tax=Nocardioides bigeumensis TaxID=433657 RepID=A0ABP5KCR1_9ACTN